jgi:hypothetical protein
MDGSIEERLRACYAALNRRDFDEFETFLHPDVEARSLVMEPEAAVYRGPAAGSRLPADYTGFIAVNHDGGMLTRAIFMRTEEEARAALGSESG